jgi:hypothetical protein
MRADRLVTTINEGEQHRFGALLVPREYKQIALSDNERLKVVGLNDAISYRKDIRPANMPP